MEEELLSELESLEKRKDEILFDLKLIQEDKDWFKYKDWLIEIDWISEFHFWYISNFWPWVDWPHDLFGYDYVTYNSTIRGTYWYVRWITVIYKWKYFSWAVLNNGYDYASVILIEKVNKSSISKRLLSVMEIKKHQNNKHVK